jgi:c-di-AMP phosphodiesterase-like protein
LYRSKKFFQSEKLSKIKKSSAENATMNRFAGILKTIEKNEIKSVNKYENNSLNGESILSLDKQ